jgi:hypothetical protein
MRELQVLDDKLADTKALAGKMPALRKQHLALALFHALKLLLKGDAASFSRYFAFVRRSPYFGLNAVVRLSLIPLGKVQFKMRPTAHRWLRACVRKPL